MRPTIGFTALFALVLFFISCGSDSTTEQTTEKKYTLTPKERFYCDSLKIDTTVVTRLRELNRTLLHVYNPEPLWVYLEDGSVQETPSKLRGFYIEAEQHAARDLVDALGEEFLAKGYTIFVCESNFGNDLDKVAIVNTSDKYLVLKETGTDGINYDIDNDSVLKIIHRFDEQYDLTLIGANLDWCEFSIGKQPTNWTGFAQACYDVCPDIVDQGTGSIEDLALEMKRTGTLYLWWD